MSTLLNNLDPQFSQITQTNYIERQILDAIQPEIVWASQTDDHWEVYPKGVGIPNIVSVRGLLAPNTVPNNVSDPGDINAGVVFAGGQYEQFVIFPNKYNGGDQVDLHVRDLPVADKYIETLIGQAQKAAVSIDFVARNTGYKTYIGSTTHVVANTGLTQVWVDDITGFQPLTGAQGEVPTANVVVGANTYVLQSTVANSIHTATSLKSSADGTMSGVPGYLTFTSNVATADLATNQPVVAQAAPLTFWANAVHNTLPTVAAGDTLSLDVLMDAANSLFNNRMENPTLFISANALRGLYNDEAFQILYRGQYKSSAYRDNEVGELLGVRIKRVTTCPTIVVNGLTIHVPLMVTDGWIQEARMTHTMLRPVDNEFNDTRIVGNLGMITTPPIDPQKQFLKIVYVAAVGYACRTDRLVTPAEIPSASYANYKRAAAIFCTAK